jgi:hypothetical protein
LSEQAAALRMVGEIDRLEIFAGDAIDSIKLRETLVEKTVAGE